MRGAHERERWHTGVTAALLLTAAIGSGGDRCVAQVGAAAPVAPRAEPVPQRTAPHWHELRRVPLTDVDRVNVSVAFARGGQAVAVALAHETLLVDVADGRLRHFDRTRMVATGAHDGEVLVANGSSAWTIDAATGRIGSDVSLPGQQTTGLPSAVAASPVGDKLCVSRPNAGTWVMALDGTQPVQIQHPWDARRLAWSEDNKWLASIRGLFGMCGMSPPVRKVNVFAVDGAAPVACPDLPRNDDVAEAVAFSPNGERLIVGGRLAVRHYSVPGMKLLREQKRPVHAFWFIDPELAVSHDHVRLTLWRALELVPIGTVDPVPVGDAEPPGMVLGDIEQRPLPITAAAAAPCSRRVAVVAMEDLDAPRGAAPDAAPEAAPHFVLILGELR